MIIKPFHPLNPVAQFAETGKLIEIIYPQPDAKIYVPLEINGERGKTVFTAAHRRAGAKIFWSLDDEFVGTTQNFHQVGLNPTPGKHVITLVDENGISVTRQFEILRKRRIDMTWLFTSTFLLKKKMIRLLYYSIIVPTFNTFFKKYISFSYGQ